MAGQARHDKYFLVNPRVKGKGRDATRPVFKQSTRWKMI
jgi:hypothetical protein